MKVSKEDAIRIHDLFNEALQNDCDANGRKTGVRGPKSRRRVLRLYTEVTDLLGISEEDLLDGNGSRVSS